MFSAYIGAEVNHTSLKNAGEEKSAWLELTILVLLAIICYIYKKNMTSYKHEILHKIFVSLTDTTDMAARLVIDGQ